MKTTFPLIAILLALFAAQRAPAFTIAQFVDVPMNPDVGVVLPPALSISLFEGDDVQVVEIDEFKFELRFGVGNVGSVSIDGTEFDLFTDAVGYTQTYEGSSGFFSLTGETGGLYAHRITKPEYFRFDYSDTNAVRTDLDTDLDSDPTTGNFFHYEFNTPTGSTLRMIEGTGTLSGGTTVSSFTATGNEWVNDTDFILTGSTPEPSRAALSLLAIAATLLPRRRRS